MTLRMLKARLISILKDCRPSDLEARLIIRHVLHLGDAAQITERDMEIDSHDAGRCIDLAERRASGVPMSYITGTKEFYGLKFDVDPGVLIPRPETENLVTEVLSFLAGIPHPTVLDLCTGSGCIATAIKKHRPDADVHMSDISEKALETARGNFERITGEKARTFLGDLFSPLDGTSYDAVCTNPPYVASCWYAGLEKEVRMEPPEALLGGGDDGLDIIRRIIPEAPKHMKPGAMLIIEADGRQAQEIRRLMTEEGFHGVRTVMDLEGKERCTLGTI